MPVLRLHKFLADAGVASRRAAEQWMRDGRVTVNGTPALEPGCKVDPLHDRVLVDGQPVRAARRLYVALHKPRGYLCTRKDPEERQIVGDLLPSEWSSLYPVGRLDRDSEGLLFLTNDGEFCLHLTHPRYGVHKRYLAVVEGKLDPALLPRLTAGIPDGGETLRAEGAALLAATKSASTVELVLREGRYREVRRMFAALGHRVIRLQRVQIGPIRLGELRPGRWRTLTPAEVKTLLTTR
ncbi:MAG: pseudouridine synthase [Limisphaerales bacterium]